MKTLTIDSHGALLRVRAPEAVAERLCDEVSFFARLRAGGPCDEAFVVVPVRGDRFRLARRDGAVEMTGTAGEVVTGVVDRVHRIASQTARTAMFVHAAVFGWGDAVIVVPGRSHSGKSSLVAAALAQGARYFSDEFAVFDDDGLVHPYARPVSLREPQGRRRSVAAPDLGGEVAASPARPTLVVCTSYEHGATWDPETLEGAQAALPLIDNTVRARAEPQRMLRIAAKVATNAVTLVGPRGEAAETVARLRGTAARAGTEVSA